MIGFLPIIYKQLVTVCRGTGSAPNYKKSESHTPLTAVLFLQQAGMTLTELDPNIEYRLGLKI